MLRIDGATAIVYANCVPSARLLCQRLHKVGSDLPSDLAAQIVALGRNATPSLLQLLDGLATTEESDGTSVADGCADCDIDHGEWARLHAVDLLTELRDPAAIDAMLKVLARTSSDQPIHDKIVERLPDFGGAALEPILEALEQVAIETKTAETLCCVLSMLGLRDERILKALLNLLIVHPRAGAAYLADYGDPAACPPMLSVITAFGGDFGDPTIRMQLSGLLDAYASLGGELPESLKTALAARLGNHP